MNGDTTLTLQRTEDSYCANCRQPRRVGVFTVQGWRFAVPVCGECLRRVTEAVEGAAATPTSREEDYTALIGVAKVGDRLHFVPGNKDVISRLAESGREED